MHFSSRTSLSFLMVALTFSAALLMTAPARAESTFLLQFGSFNTEAQAEQKWTDIKTKNTDVVGKLTLHVAEVALPPDNTTMYRTQAGPVSSHDDAAALCGTLQSRGVECYVVETAMFTSEPLPSQALNDTPPTVVAPASTLPAATETAPVALPPSPVPAAAVMSAPPAVMAAPAVIPSPNVGSAAMAPAEDTPMPLSDESASASSSAIAPITVVEPAPQASKPGFFGRLFGRSSEPAPPPTQAAAPAEATPAPAAVLATPVVAPSAATPAAPAAMAMAAPEMAPSAAPADTPTIAYVPAPPPPTLPSVPAPSGEEVAPGVILLPTADQSAPAPTAEAQKPGFFGRMFGSSAPAPAPVAVAAAEPVVPAPVAPLPTAIAAPAAPSTPTVAPITSMPAFTTPPVVVPPAPNVVGNVNVAEAIRVPLGSGGGGPSKPLAKLPPVHGLGGFPSAPNHKSVWAQISYFADENEARSFYESFHAAYPQFSDGVRVRITRPYSSSAGRVSLRVGPFAGTSDVRTICAAANQRGARCTVVREISNSVAANTPNRRAAYSTAFDDRSLAAASPSADDTHNATYWVQLGTYRSPDTAWDNWNDLKDDNKKLLAHVHATVTTPPMSSASRANFRLRAGPFVSEVSANSLCNKLQETGASCIVLNDR